MKLCALVLLIFDSTYASLQLSDSGCYGNPPDNTVHAQCNPGEIVIIESVYGYAKAQSTGCPNQQTTGQPAPAGCCSVTGQECPIRYRGTSETQYYDKCQGQRSCSETNVAWAESHGCSNDYLPLTNFMVLYYQCVLASSIPGHCDDVISTGSEVYLWNSGYSSPMAASSNCTCAVMASCDTGIEVHALDIEFDGAPCRQTIKIVDDDVITQITCSENNRKITELIYTSTKNYFILLAENELASASGRFFLQLKGHLPNSDVTVACGNKMSSLTSTNSKTCPVTTSTVDDVTLLSKNLSFVFINSAVIKSDQNITLITSDRVSWFNDTHQEIKVSRGLNVTSAGNLVIDNEEGTTVTLIGGALHVDSNVTVFSSSESETSANDTFTELQTSSDVRLTSSVHDSSTPRMLIDRLVLIEGSGNQSLTTDGDIVPRAGNWSFNNGYLELVDGELDILDERISLRLRGNVQITSGTIETNNDNIVVNVGSETIIEGRGKVSVADGSLTFDQGQQNITIGELKINNNGTVIAKADDSLYLNGSISASFRDRNFITNGTAYVNDTLLIIQSGDVVVTSHPFRIVTNGTVMQSLTNPGTVSITSGRTEISNDMISTVTDGTVTLTDDVIYVDGSSNVLRFLDNTITTNGTITMTTNKTSVEAAYAQVDNAHFRLQTNGSLEMADDTLFVRAGSVWLRASSNLTILRGDDVITVTEGTLLQFTGSFNWRNGSLVVPSGTYMYFNNGSTSLKMPFSVSTTGTLVLEEETVVQGGNTKITDENVSISTLSNVSIDDDLVTITGGHQSRAHIGNFEVDTNGTLLLNKSDTSHLNIVQGTHVIENGDFVITTVGNVTIRNGSLYFDHSSFDFTTKRDMVLIKDGKEHRIDKHSKVSLTGEIRIVNGTLIVTGGQMNIIADDEGGRAENADGKPPDDSGDMTNIIIAITLLLVIATAIVIIMVVYRSQKCRQCFKKKPAEEEEDAHIVRQRATENMLFGTSFTGPSQVAPHGTNSTSPQIRENRVHPSPLLPEPIVPPPNHLPALKKKEYKRKKHGKKDRKKKERELIKKENELNVKEANSEQRETSLKKLDSNLNSSLRSGGVPNEIQTDAIDAKRVNNSFSIGSSKKMKNIGTVVMASNAFKSSTSRSICVDITDNESGELLSSHMSEA